MSEYKEGEEIKVVCYVCGKEIDPFNETPVLVFDDDEGYYECESCHQYALDGRLETICDTCGATVLVANGNVCPNCHGEVLAE